MLLAQEPAYNVQRDTVELEITWEDAKKTMEENRRHSMNPLWKQLTVVSDAVDLSPTDLYFTNLAKCNDGDSSWQTRFDQCRGYLLRELEVVSPKILLLYGRDVIDAILELCGLEPPSKISEVHAQPQEVPGRTLIPLYHWAYAARSGWIDRYNRGVTQVVQTVFPE